MRQEIILEDGPNELSVDFTGRGTLSGKTSPLGAQELGSLFVFRCDRLTPRMLDKIREFRDDPEGRSVAYSVVAADGSFHLEGLEPGEYAALLRVCETRDSPSRGQGGMIGFRRPAQA